LFFSLRRSTIARRSLLVTTILTWGWLQTNYYINTRLALSLANALQYFLAGFLLCDFYLVGWERIRSHWLWDVVCLPLWTLVFSSNDRWFNVWLPLASVVLYVGAFKGPLLSRLFRNSIIAVTGGMCYSIYLTHNLTLTLTESLFRWVGAPSSCWALKIWLVAILEVLIVFAVGLLFYILLERPCMERDWPQRLALYFKLHRPPNPAER
jgi:peptidoglycan/LPS O-acetylase OafA/YrhL